MADNGNKVEVKRLSVLVNFASVALYFMRMWFYFILLTVLIDSCDTIKCTVGFGQRGKLHQNGITWPRTCPEANHCWEAYIPDISTALQLFTFQWGVYYDKYYIRACGGDYGTQPTVVPPLVFNITKKIDIKGKGGTKVVNLAYACESDFCSTAFRKADTQYFIFIMLLLGSSLMSCIYSS